MEKIILIYITNPSKKVAKKIAKHLISKKLIACANIYNINSLYPWKNKLTDDKEVVLIGKTLEEKFEKLKQEVENQHPYSIPCIIKIPVEVNKKYFEWVREVLK